MKVARFCPNRFFALCALFLITGCASGARVMPDTSHLQWPLPPAEARLKYVRWWSGEADFGKSFAEQVLGESRVPKLQLPRSVTTDKRGNIYVADLGAGLLVFDLVAGKFDTIETTGAIPVEKPVDVKVDDSGDLWVADTGRKRVIRYTKEGKFLTAIAKENVLSAPIRLALDKERGRLYVLDRLSHSILVYDLLGTFLFTIGHPNKSGSEQGYFFNPQGMALDREGNIYVADTFNFRVQSFTQDGKFRLEIGQLGDGPGQFGRPVDVAVDSDGNLYVADLLFNNVQVFDKKGTYMFTVGELGNNPGQFNLPAGLHIDENDRLYVADQYNGIIQVFQYLSETWKKKQEGLQKK